MSLPSEVYATPALKLSLLVVGTYNAPYDAGLAYSDTEFNPYLKKIIHYVTILSFTGVG
jgi:hypothetical protein